MSLSNFAEAALIALMFQKTSSWGTASTPPTLHAALHSATTLFSSASSGQPVISTAQTMSIGTTVIVGVGTGNAEAHTVQNVTGAGPFTVTLDANLANAHGAGENVSFKPADDGSDLLEPTEGSYARVATAAVDWNNPVQGNPTVVDNANAIAFAAATEDWATGRYITHGLLFDALTAGNYLGSGALTTMQPVLNGNTASFPAGNFNVTIGGVPF